MILCFSFQVKLKPMAKVMEYDSEMAHARHNDGINVIFDQKSPASSPSRSRSRSSDKSSHSSVSSHYRGRGSHRRRYRSPSSSTSSSCSRSSSQPRSRSRPRCHRRSSRCRCDSHHRYGRRRYRRSSPRRCRDRSRSRSSSRQSRHRRAARRCRLSRSPPRTNRRNSDSRSSKCSLTLEGKLKFKWPLPRQVHFQDGKNVKTFLCSSDKRQLLGAAQANAKTILGTEKLELPQTVKPTLPEQPESKWESLEPETRVRQAPEKTSSQVGVWERLYTSHRTP